MARRLLALILASAWAWADGHVWKNEEASAKETSLAIPAASERVWLAKRAEVGAGARLLAVVCVGFDRGADGDRLSVRVVGDRNGLPAGDILFEGEARVAVTGQVHPEEVASKAAVEIPSVVWVLVAMRQARGAIACDAEPRGTDWYWDGERLGGEVTVVDGTSRAATPQPAPITMAVRLRLEGDSAEVEGPAADGVDDACFEGASRTVSAGDVVVLRKGGPIAARAEFSILDAKAGERCVVRIEGIPEGLTRESDSESTGVRALRVTCDGASRIVARVRLRDRWFPLRANAASDEHGLSVDGPPFARLTWTGGGVLELWLEVARVPSGGLTGEVIVALDAKAAAAK